MQYEITEAEIYEIKQALLHDALDEQVNYKNLSNPSAHYRSLERSQR